METLELERKLTDVKVQTKFRIAFDQDSKKEDPEAFVHDVKVEYDFSGVILEQLIQDAAIKHLNVKAQSALRDRFATAEHMAGNIEESYSFNVAELLTPAKRSKDPVKQASNAVGRMTEAQKQAFLQAIQESQW